MKHVVYVVFIFGLSWLVGSLVGRYLAWNARQQLEPLDEE